jgi:hypothetical protein
MPKKLKHLKPRIDSLDKADLRFISGVRGGAARQTTTKGAVHRGGGSSQYCFCACAAGAEPPLADE